MNEFTCRKVWESVDPYLVWEAAVGRSFCSNWCCHGVVVSSLLLGHSATACWAIAATVAAITMRGQRCKIISWITRPQLYSFLLLLLKQRYRLIIFGAWWWSWWRLMEMGISNFLEPIPSFLVAPLIRNRLKAASQVKHHHHAAKVALSFCVVVVWWIGLAFWDRLTELYRSKHHSASLESKVATEPI